jgi:AcrR family transcriptional regulator
MSRAVASGKGRAVTTRGRRGGRGDATRTRILDAAEKLIASEGYATVSLRRITQEAKANVAAVNYYFKSKDALLEAIFVRRIVPINEERMRLLDACVASGVQGAERLEGIVRAFVEPHLRLTTEFGAGGTVVMQLLGRLSTDSGRRIERILLKQYDPIWWRFSKAFQEALPHLGRQTIYWRFYYLLGTLYYVTTARQWLPSRSEDLCHPERIEDVIRSMVPFLVGALMAPEAPVERKRRPRAAGA